MGQTTAAWARMLIREAISRFRKDAPVMRTQPRKPAVSGAHRARHQGLQAMLREGQRDMQDVLQRRVRRTAQDGPDNVLDDTEQAEADVQHDIEAAVIEMKRDALQRVREALGRLDAGGDGHCAVCENAIPARRLQVQPFAVRCTACEDAEEQRAARERPRRAPQGFDWR
jgi:DnaK suppressor protein